MNESLSGTLRSHSHVLQQRVYFEHTDFSGVVYHARYLDFLEHGRSDYVRLLGVHHRELSDGSYGESLAFAVHRMEIDFRGAARIDDVLDVETERGVLRGPKLTFQQRICRNGDELLSAKVTVVLVNQAGKPRRFPKSLIEKMGVGDADQNAGAAIS